MIEHYLHAINNYIQMHPHMGMFIAFIVALGESLPLIGTIIPGSITMTAIGVLIGRNIIPGLPTLFWATIGALIGDTIGFWIGKYFNEDLRKIWPFKKHPKWLSKGEDFFNKHGGKSILVGRFVGPARSSVPLIAGLLKMSWARFFIAAVPSAILWAILYMVPGVLIGAISLELPKGATTKFIIIGLLIIVCLWLVFWAIQRFFVFLAACINRCIDRLWNGLSRHHSSHFLISLISNRKNPEDHHQLTLVTLALISFILFLVILANVLHNGILTHLNVPLFHFLQSIRTHSADNVFVAITMLGKSYVIITISLVVAMGLLWKQQWRTCAHLLALVIVAGLAVYFFKWVMYSPRPDGFLYSKASSSFPSGHMTLSVTIWGLLSFFIAQQLKKEWRWIPYTTATILITCIGFSRLYLGAHWLTDILGALFLGFTILLLVITTYRCYPPKPFLNTTSIIFLVLAILVPWTAFTIVKFHSVRRSFTQTWSTKTMYMSDWWSHPTQFAPLYRFNRFGRPIQPFNVQWAAELTAIKQQLLKNGWAVIHTKADLRTALGRFASYNPEQHFPFLPLLYRHKHPALFVIKHLPQRKTIIELRLWASGITFSNSHLPLWIGSIDYHTPPHHLIALKKLEQITLADDAGITNLTKDINDYQWKIVHIPLLRQPKRIIPLQWNGSVLVVRPLMENML